jgi:hypothetical protein
MKIKDFDIDEKFVGSHSLPLEGWQKFREFFTGWLKTINNEYSLECIVKIQLLLNSRSVYNQCIFSRHKSNYEKTAVIGDRIHSACIM